jgi:hypothetical protein
MRRFIQFISFFTLALVLCTGLVFADENTLRLESKVVESFDNPESGVYDDGSEGKIVWRVFGSKFATEGYPKMAYANNTWPIDLFGVRPENPEALGVLGLHAKFDRMGYNQIEIIPGTGDGESWTAKPVPLPGRVQTVDFWAWGSQFDYTIELYFMDYEGRKFRLVPLVSDDRRYPGTLNYTGWKNMFVEIPGYIRQAQKYKPSHKKLTLTKIVIFTHPDERVDNFYFYIDHLKVLSDFQETFFDGGELTSPEKIEEIWGKE